jgi:hypothetical protein
VYTAWNDLSDSVGVETLESERLFRAIFILEVPKIKKSPIYENKNSNSYRCLMCVVNGRNSNGLYRIANKFSVQTNGNDNKL